MPPSDDEEQVLYCSSPEVIYGGDDE
jgi:hypothetical protein